jgi:hypothetical protein
MCLQKLKSAKNISEETQTDIPQAHMIKGKNTLDGDNTPTKPVHMKLKLEH